MKQGNASEAKYGNGACSGHINLQIKVPSFNPQRQSYIQKWKRVEKNGMISAGGAPMKTRAENNS